MYDKPTESTKQESSRFSGDGVPEKSRKEFTERSSPHPPPARLVYEGSNGDATKAYYGILCAKGPLGVVAMNLFRAQKASTRAKLYRGGGFRDAAYQKKEWSLGLLVDALILHGQALGISFGWGIDDKIYEGHRHVLYIELPQGQVSFHGTTRGKGPDHNQPWDGARGQSPVRIIAFCDAVLGLPPDGASIAPEIPPRNAKRRARFNAERDAQLQKSLL